MYSFYFKDPQKKPKYFYSDDPYPLDCVADFVEEHQDEIADRFADHFPETIDEYFHH